MRASIVLTALLSTVIWADKRDNFHYYATRKEPDIGMLQQMLEEDPGVLNHQLKHNGQTPIMAATLRGVAESVKFLLAAGADITIGEQQGYTPLHGAGFQGRDEVARILIEHGMDPAEFHEDGNAPFHRACWGGKKRHARTVEVFLDAGVDPEFENEDGKKCLDMTNNRRTKALVAGRIDIRRKGQEGLQQVGSPDNATQSAGNATAADSSGYKQEL